MGNLLPSFGRRKLPMLEMPKVGGSGGGGGLALGAIQWLAADPGSKHVELNGQGVSVADPKFPYQTPAGRSFSAYTRPDATAQQPSQFYWVQKIDDFYLVGGSDSAGNGSIFKSQDLKTYSQKFSLGNGDIFRCILKFGNVITASGYSFRYSLDNGDTWLTPAQPWSGVTIKKMVIGNGLIVGVAETNAIYYSSDGVNFQRYLVPNANVIADIVFARGKFYACGADAGGNGIIYTSSDAVNWTIVVQGANAGFTAIAATQGAIMAVPSNNVNCYTRDGTNWNYGSAFSAQTLLEFFASDDYFCAIDQNYQIFISADPAAWSGSNLGSLPDGGLGYPRSKGASDMGGGKFILAGTYSANGTVFGWWCRLTVGNAVIALPDLPSRTLKSGQLARPFMRIAS